MIDGHTCDYWLEDEYGAIIKRCGLPAFRFLGHLCGSVPRSYCDEHGDEMFIIMGVVDGDIRLISEEEYIIQKVLYL